MEDFYLQLTYTLLLLLQFSDGVVKVLNH